MVLAPGVIDSSGLAVRATTRALAPGSQVVWSVRPERISLRPDGQYEATLVDDVDLGVTRELLVSIGKYLQLLVRTDRSCDLEIKGHYRIDIPAEDIHVWPATGEDEPDPYEGTVPRDFA
jgi:hypothetical protein